MYKWFWRNKGVILDCVKTNITQYIVVVLIQAICLAVSVLMPLLNMKLINLFVYENINKEHGYFACMYLFVLFFSVCLSYFTNIQKRSLELRMQKLLQNEVISYSVQKKRREFDINEIGEIDAKIKVDALTFQQFVFGCVLDFPFSIVKLLFICVILCWQSYEIAIAIYFVQLFVLLIQKKLCKSVDKQSIIARDKFTELNEVLSDVIGKMPYISTLGASKYLHHRFSRNYDNYIKCSVNHTKYISRASLIVEFTLSLNYVMVLGIGSYKIYNGTLLVGALLSIVQYMGSFLSSFSSICNYFVDLRGEKKKLDNIIDILQANGCTKEKTDTIQTDSIQKLVLSDITFSYVEANNIFENMSAEFFRGKLNCILGPSGSGKSTLLKLILGDYPLRKGEIYAITDTGKIDLKKDVIGFVPQENLFFTDTIYNNIVLGQDISPKEVYRICRECSIYEDIKNLENGFETIISNGISNFSGGQIKRLSIARAIIQNKEILLVDEPTAGLDSENTKMVVDCIQKYANTKLVVIITHDKYIKEKASPLYQLVDKQLQSDNEKAREER